MNLPKTIMLLEDPRFVPPGRPGAVLLGRCGCAENMIEVGGWTEANSETYKEAILAVLELIFGLTGVEPMRIEIRDAVNDFVVMVHEPVAVAHG